MEEIKEVIFNALEDLTFDDTDQVIYDIVSLVDITRFDPNGFRFDVNGETRVILPFWTKDEYKKNYHALKEALEVIEEENILIGKLVLTEYPRFHNMLGLDVTDVKMSDYAIELAGLSRKKVKLKSWAGKLIKGIRKYDSTFKQKMNYYEQFSDEELLRRLKCTTSNKERYCIYKVLKERGY